MGGFSSCGTKAIGRFLARSAAVGVVLGVMSGVTMAQVSGGGTVTLERPAEGGLAVSPRPRPNPATPPVAPASEPAAETAQPETTAPATTTAAPADTTQPTTKRAKPPRDPSKGAVTNLPIPRYVSLKGNEGNARRGPSLTHRIDWVFTTSGMPLRVTAEHENWRRVEDAEGLGGWVHYALLSGVRSAMVSQERAEFRMKPNPSAPVMFIAERGVIGRLLACERDWCRMNVQGERGWVLKTALWGVDAGEILE